MDGSGGLTVRPSRRQFCLGVAGLGLATGGLALLAGCGGSGQPIAPAAGEAPPETTRLRMWRSPSLCHAPQLLAEPFLRTEGFTDVQYVALPPARATSASLAEGELDMTILFSAPNILRVDINFVVLPTPESMKRLEEGTIDAFLGFPPLPQELRARKIGHIVLNSAVDKSWSQYFCCMLTGNKEFVQRNPVATKRAVRAYLKATDLCAAQPEVAAQALVDAGYAPQLDYARQTLQEIPYSRWREYDPEDAIRFHSLRLQEVGMIKSTPDKIIAQGTDWRFLNELKRELKT